MLAVELTCAARGLELRAPLEPARGTAAALAALRRVIPGAGPDRWLAPELAAVDELLATGGLIETVEGEIGELA
jgi:histidine ammonia-lyase